MRKIRDFVVYADSRYYCAFPSIVRRPDGELIVAFRRAPDRRLMGGTTSHCDANSQLVLVRSKDNGATWTQEPELIHSHALGGSQDPCLCQLNDNTLLCSSYLWVLTPPEWPNFLHKANGGNFGFAGGYLVRSDDSRHWQGPLDVPPAPGNAAQNYLGQPLPAYNRGRMIHASDGVLYWVVVRWDTTQPRRTSTHLYASKDRGLTWEYRCPVAADAKASFNETSLVETKDGDLVAFMRTGEMEGRAAVARSRDRGKSFEPWQDAGFRGFPQDVIRLRDGRIFVVYGYRFEPFGVRARVLAPDARDTATAAEIILRDDGGSGDLGYPWAVELPSGEILTVYYINTATPASDPKAAQESFHATHGSGSERIIAGTLLAP